MPNYTKPFNPKKLKEIRELRKLNRTQLADILELSRQAISYYEGGSRVPKSEVILKLSNKLNVPYEFFFSEPLPTHSDYTTFYRKLSTTTVKENTASNIVRSIGEKAYDLLTTTLDLPNLDLPSLDFLLNEKELNPLVIEQIASETRRCWGISQAAPIQSVLKLLETKGIILVDGSRYCEKIDAAITPDIVHPIIVMGEKTMSSLFRQNFSLAHELGHILLHRYITSEDLQDNELARKIENEANLFASFFLLPTEPFLESITSFKLDSLILLKQKWFVSLSCILYRLRDLQVISSEDYTNYNKQISYKKWKKQEPLDQKYLADKPTLFKISLDIIQENNIETPEGIFAPLNIDLQDLTNILGLPDNYFSTTLPLVIELR